MPSVGMGWISDFRDTPFQALPASQTSKQDELAGPAGVGSSPVASTRWVMDRQVIHLLREHIC